MHDKPSLLRQAWNLLRGHDRLENKDGTLTTKFGARIVPYRITVSRTGLSLRANVDAFCFQPRAFELQEQMKPLLTAQPGDSIVLDDRSGKFYLQSALTRDGGRAHPLGQIDLALEKLLFEHAKRMIVMRKLFGDASPDNPIVVDDNGRIYAKNKPAETRGQAHFGQTIENPATKRKPGR